MGKGDKRSKKGKISSGTFGVRRPRKSAKLKQQEVAPKPKAKPKKAAAKKAKK